MAPVTNSRIIYNSPPQGLPIPGITILCDTTQSIDPDEAILSGGFLIKVLELSVDPYLRGRMQGRMGATYIPWFEPGQIITTFGIGVVLRSENPEVKVGAYVYGIIESQEYIIRGELLPANPLEHLTIIQNDLNLPLSTFLGILGMPGRSAYYAWKEFAHAKPGDTVLVSTAAGAVGSLVVQLAKRDECKVIACAGSDAKLAFARELGADVVFNYKTTCTADVLRDEGPIDIYWDNVGGEMLDAALDAATFGARFIECGMTTGYNDGYVSTNVRNLFHVVTKSIVMSGFVNSQFEGKYGQEFLDNMPKMVASGELKYREHVYTGIESFGDAFLGLFKGENIGKAIVHVAGH